MNEMFSLMKDISIVDFTMTDLRLYLDTHPYDARAMEYYSHYAGIKRKLEKEFAMKYYPLSSEFSQCENEWRWVLSPMPWENEANQICMCKGGN
ncbi:MAG: spore coat protein CotJB [Lachnospiraceae bacterium]